MVTKLNQYEKEQFMKIIQTDMDAIEVKMFEQIKFYWEQAREEQLKFEGHDKLMEKKRFLKLELQRITQEINEIENRLVSEPLTVNQTIELSGSSNDYGKWTGANFFGIPVTSQFEYKIVQKIKDRVDFEAPAKFLHNLGRSSMRELIMTGTFEDAQEIYAKFYQLDFRKYGVDIPPRIGEMKKEMKQLEEKSLLFGKETQKLIDGKQAEGQNAMDAVV